MVPGRAEPAEGEREEGSFADDSTQDQRQPPPIDGLAVVLEGDRLEAGGKLFPLTATALEIGRGRSRALYGDVDARLELPDAKLSARHARLTRHRSIWTIEDLGSANGTWVGGERITRQRVDCGEAIRVGHSLLTIVADAGPALDHERGDAWPFHTLSSQSARGFAALRKVASGTTPILILGGKGAGKKAIARAVHARSGRQGAFVVVGCATLPASLIEAHLFGHQRGAFLGAARDELGFFRAAEGGTILLDEVGDLPATTQAALLRVLTDGAVTPVGAFSPVPVDVRVVAATRRPLAEWVSAGRFRADLYARLAVHVFRVVPLRERRQDLGVLLASFASELGRDVRVRPEAAEALYESGWPLDVRGLKTAFEAVVSRAEGGVVRATDLPDWIFTPLDGEPSVRPLSPEERLLRDQLAERLFATSYDVEEVARQMGYPRKQVEHWIIRYGLHKG